MPATCDSVACGKELLHKSQILSSLKMGWRPVADGEIPWNAPAPDLELMKGEGHHPRPRLRSLRRAGKLLLPVL